MTIPEDVREALAAATPGPWALNRPLGERSVTVLGAHGFPVARGTVETNLGGRDQAHADAHLIANAPTWLAALCDENDRLREVLERIIEANPGSTVTYYRRIAKAAVVPE